MLRFAAKEFGNDLRFAPDDGEDVVARFLRVSEEGGGDTASLGG
jgi:hypothetical protein